MTQPALEMESSNALDLTKFDPKKDPAEADSSLELVLLLLCNALKLSAPQVLTLFTNHNKYLAHLIVKGFKGEFKPISVFYESLIGNLDRLIELFQTDPNSKSFTLYALKPGFVSKSRDVSALTLEVFSSTSADYVWLVGDSKCLLTMMMGVRRHPDLGKQFGDVLMEIVGDNRADFFKNHYKQRFENSVQLLQTTGPLLSTFGRSPVRQQLSQLKIFKEWTDLALQGLESSDKPKPEYKSAAVKFFTSLWISVPEEIQSNQDVYSRFVSSIKQDWKSRSIEQFLTIVTEVFFLFYQLTVRKNPSAKVIIDLLGIILEQLIDCDDQRCIMLGGFAQSLKAFPAMPPNLFLQHYVQLKTLQSFDLEFIQFVIHSQSLNGRTAIILQNICGRMVCESLLNKPLVDYLVTCVNKFPEDSLQSVSRITKQLLTAIFDIEKTRKPVKKPMPSYNSKKAAVSKVTPQMETQIISAQHLYIMMDCLKKLISISPAIKEKISPLVMSVTAQLKHLKKEPSKSMLSLLAMCNQKGVQYQSVQEEAGTRKQSRDFNITKARRSVTSSQMVGESQMRSRNKPDVPQSVAKHLQQLRQSIVEKKRKQQKQLATKDLDNENKREKTRKEVDRIKLMKGFGGEAQLMDEGYWQKKIQTKDRVFELVDPETLEPCQVEYIDIIIKKYHRVLRQIFVKYAATGYTSKNPTNFDQQSLRTETLSLMQCIKMLKDNKLFGLTDLQEVQNLVREVNIKLLKKRETQEFDYAGFEQFVVQFALIVFSRPHTTIIKRGAHAINKESDIDNIPAQVLEKLFTYLRNVAEAKGETTVLFDDPDTAYFNQTEIIQEFNKKLEQDPGFILPEGYKKIIDRSIHFELRINKAVLESIVLPESYIDCYEIVNEMVMSAFGVNTIEPISSKVTKAKVKPCGFINIQSKLRDMASESSYKVDKQSRPRGLSSQEGKKVGVLPMLEKRVLSFGIKMGLSYVPYKDKMLGEQVAYVIDDMITAIEDGRSTIEKNKIVNQASKQKQIQYQQEQKIVEQREKKRADRKRQLQGQKRQLFSLKQKEKEEAKESEQQKKTQEQLKAKKKEEDKGKYIQQQRAKIEEQKRKKDLQLKEKIDLQKENAKKRVVEDKKKFNDFNQKQIQKMKEQVKAKNAEEEGRKKKLEDEGKSKIDRLKNLRSKYKSEDEAVVEAKVKASQQLKEIFNSESIQSTFKKHELVLRILYDFLIKSTFQSLTDKGHNNEVISESWLFYNIAFKISPHILNPKEVNIIFTSLTKAKTYNSQKFKVGLDYNQFLESLLRSSIKKKLFFNAIGEKLQESKQSETKDLVIELEPQKLLKEGGMNDKIADDYGDLSKVDQNTLQGYLYYLKLPSDKVLLDKRLRQVQQESKKRGKAVHEQLKQQLNKQMPTLSPKIPRKKKPKQPVQGQQSEQLESKKDIQSQVGQKQPQDQEDQSQPQQKQDQLQDAPEQNESKQ